MQRNRIDFSKNSKLKSNANSLPQRSINIIKPKTVAKPRSFRLRDVDIERLESALKRVNYENGTVPFNRTDLIRGLIMIAHQTSTKKLLNSIRNSW